MNDKRLAEKAGVCLHETLDGKIPATKCLDCGKEEHGGQSWEESIFYTPDFLTPDGYDLLHKAISEKGEWVELYRWIEETYFLDVRSVFNEEYLCEGLIGTFHELPVSEKAPIIDQWLESLEEANDE